MLSRHEKCRILKICAKETNVTFEKSVKGGIFVAVEYTDHMFSSQEQDLKSQGFASFDTLKQDTKAIQV